MTRDKITLTTYGLDANIRAKGMEVGKGPGKKQM